MQTYRSILKVAIILPMFLLLSNYIAAQEIDIDKTKNLPIDQIFGILMQDKYIYNEQIMNDAIYKSLKNRKQEAIYRSIVELAYPINEYSDEDVAYPNQYYDVAKAVLRRFPDESRGYLLGEFNRSENIKKANIIRVMGSMVTNSAVRDQLIKALDDQSIGEDEYDSAIPLRVCDVAYNQIVLHGRVKKVLRTIGNFHHIEIRDYHINILRSRL